MHRNGSFVWFDLMTSDVDKAKAFYGEVFNWKTEKFDGTGDYDMIKAGEHIFGGYMEAPEGMPTMWACHLSVDDVDARCEKVKKSGGKVIKEPFDMPTVGRDAVIMDASGASLCLFKAEKDDPAKAEGPGTPHWVELTTQDTAKAKDFYADAFGFSYDTMPMPEGEYLMLKPGPAPSIGGIVKSSHKDAPPMWLMYIEVDNCDATVARAKKSGAEILVDAMDMPGTGRFSIFKDPTGGVIGCIQPS